MTVAIVLVNWKGAADTIACVESCLALAGQPARILVCDNASGDGSVERILAWARGDAPPPADAASPVAIAAPRRPRGVARLDRTGCEAGDDGDGAELLVIDTGGNLGFAGGNNVGLRWALAQGCDHVWLLNNDTVVPPDALSALLAVMADDPAVGLVGSTLVEYDRPDTVQAYAGAIHRRTFRGRHLGLAIPLAERAGAERIDALRPGELLYPIGASMLVSRAFLETVGLMEEGYFLYYEEADWVLRGERHFRIALAPDSLVYHKHGASAGSTSDGQSARAVGFLYRSRLLAARRHAPALLPLVAAGMVWEAAKGLARGRTPRARAALRALTGRVAVPKAMP